MDLARIISALLQQDVLCVSNVFYYEKGICLVT